MDDEDKTIPRRATTSTDGPSTGAAGEGRAGGSQRVGGDPAEEQLHQVAGGFAVRDGFVVFGH